MRVTINTNWGLFRNRKKESRILIMNDLGISSEPVWLLLPSRPINV